MKVKDGKNGTTEDEGRSERRKPKSEPRSLGDVSNSSGEYGTYSVSAFGGNSYEQNTFIAGERTDERIAGKLVRQLIEETEKQLAYYEQQADALRKRLQELKKVSETTTDSN